MKYYNLQLKIISAIIAVALFLVTTSFVLAQTETRLKPKTLDSRNVHKSVKYSSGAKQIKLSHNKTTNIQEKNTNARKANIRDVRRDIKVNTQTKQNKKM